MSGATVPGLVRVLLVLLVALAFVPCAPASQPLGDLGVTGVTLAVDAKGEALLTYRSENGAGRHVLARGAINARAPSQDVPQVAFRFDYSGGWKSHGRQVWAQFVNRCRPYDGPALPYLVAACKAPDGTYWAVQAWYRLLPMRGFAPWLPDQGKLE